MKSIERQEAALERIQERLHELIMIEPAIGAMLQIAAQHVSGCDRWHAYSALKQVGYRYVGWGAVKNGVSTSRQYEQFIAAIDELLPDERVGDVDDEFHDMEELTKAWESVVEQGAI